MYKLFVLYVPKLRCAYVLIDLTLPCNLNAVSNNELQNQYQSHYHRSLSKEFIKHYILGVQIYPPALKQSTFKKCYGPTLKALLGIDYDKKLNEFREESKRYGPCAVLRKLLKLLLAKKEQIQNAVKDHKVSPRNLREIESTIKNVRELMNEYGCLPP